MIFASCNDFARECQHSLVTADASDQTAGTSGRATASNRCPRFFAFLSLIRPGSLPALVILPRLFLRQGTDLTSVLFFQGLRW
jgi:hypothetical protein